MKSGKILGEPEHGTALKRNVDHLNIMLSEKFAIISSEAIETTVN